MAALRLVYVWLVLILLGCCLGVGGASAQALTDLPPRVIDCNPAAFATNVDPNLAQLSITFDRPMNIQSKGGIVGARFTGVNPFPRDAQPAWDVTGTIATLPVRLEPDVTYAVAVNEVRNRGLVDPLGVPALSFFYVFTTGARTAEDFPPYVVKTDPANGGQEVDFRLKQITVTFSRPVAPGDYSWMTYKGSGEYPGARDAGLPQLSADRLTATLEVRLSPDTVYALGINDTAFLGYKDINGRPVLPYGLCFKTAQ